MADGLFDKILGDESSLLFFFLLLVVLFGSKRY